MSDIKLFRLGNGGVQNLGGESVAVEKSLQVLMEKNLDALLGVRLLASEFRTGKTHGGRIDTLGMDEDGSPVIVEYKRALNENVINQGLFYLDWLMDHRAEFELLVLKTLGEEAAENIDWSAPRLLCIAGDFTRYDEHAVQQMGRNIQLIRYRRYGEDLLLLELVNATTNGQTETFTAPKPKTSEKTITERLAQADEGIRDLYETLKASLMALGDDVQVNTLKHYFAFRRIKNFACAEVFSKKVVVYVKVDPDNVEIVPGFTRDVRKIGHYGTGDLEITLKGAEDLGKATPLLLKSYEAS